MSSATSRVAGLCCLLAVGAGLPPAAQAIVNIEDLRRDNDKQGLSGSVGLTISGASGNTDKSSSNASVQFQWRQPTTTELVIARYSYGESNRVRDTNKAFAHLRHIHSINERRALEAFVQAERNEFTRLSLRTLAGAGLRQTLHSNTNGHTYLGLGAFYSRETLEQRIGLSDAGTEKLWRGNLYLAIDYAINQQVSFNSTTYYQPATADHHDYRLLEQATLKAAISDHLAVKLALDIAHDSQPPQTVDKTDISYHSGIEYSF